MKFLKLLLLNLAIPLLFQSFLSAAEFDYKRFNDHMQNDRYQQAWEMLDDDSVVGNPDLQFQKGILLGSGLVRIENSLCEAVYSFEKAQELGALYVRGALDALYGGDWVAIASQEGERIALYETGLRYLDLKIQTNPFVYFDKLYSVKKAYQYFHQSQRLGSERPQKRKSELEKQQLDLLNLELEDSEFKKVICDVRKY